MTDKSGIGAYKGRTMGVTAADYDGDGYPDIYVANDKTENFLFHNKQDGTFEEIAGDSVSPTGRTARVLPPWALCSRTSMATPALICG